ncbi:hypothetical protein [Microbacterium sp. SORGH_AS_0888]|uniref:hypothetical protein n=1 Tax=Microbacterium sp. SORGH_AS_0888 TaxID=3041791 RepID=UPI002782E5DF|nr:hypothetical protein [Microbacterium sp. SORGH_AS_0888]MDQ1131130.1 hypothetical protein [Microbacterium sp. SORGH_AS_0888]
MNDDDLRALLRKADPSNGQKPLDDGRIRRIVAAAERDSLDGQSAPAPRRGRRLFAGVSIGAVATAAAGLVIAGLVATPAIQAPGPDETSATCAPVSVDSLREFDTAYEATATAIKGDNVTLQVTQIFAGSPSKTLTVPQPGDPSTAEGGGLFAVGKTYLVASADDYVSDCDSGLATDDLRQLYLEAFTTPTNGG